MEDDDSQSNSQDYSEEESKWGIEYTAEKNLWIDKLIKYYCYNPNKCPTCFKGDFEIKENKGESIINPFYLRCNNTKCRKKKYLRAYSFFKLHKNIPASVLLEIINLFIVIRLNVKQIKQN